MGAVRNCPIVERRTDSPAIAGAQARRTFAKQLAWFDARFVDLDSPGLKVSHQAPRSGHQKAGTTCGLQDTFLRSAKSCVRLMVTTNDCK
jgi:hypothetical protein